jgi:membrane-associated PAP2 superfamily phosphatase
MPAQIPFLGVPVTIRPTALASGVLSALVVARVVRANRVALGAAAGLLWYAADSAHVAGHIVSSQAAGAPLDAVDFGLYPKSVYYDNDVSPGQHIGRASGGLLASLLAALVLALLARTVRPGLPRRLLTIAAAQHGLLFALSMLPLRMVDGGVIYHNLKQLGR